MSLGVLLVDDHPRLRELYKIALQNTPELRVVAEAGDGATGALLAKETRPDLVVLDLSMPGRDGLQALQDIKQWAPESRVLVLSGFMRERIEPLVLEMGANAYVEKGIDLDEIGALLLRIAQDAPRAPGERFTSTELERRVRDLV